MLEILNILHTWNLHIVTKSIMQIFLHIGRDIQFYRLKWYALWYAKVFLFIEALIERGPAKEMTEILCSTILIPINLI